VERGRLGRLLACHVWARNKEFAAISPELPEGTVTILFTDVVGSTELTNRMGDEAARVILGTCDELVRQQIERHRGQEVKGTGDGLMVAFTSARRAIACAVDIQRAMAERALREPERDVGVKIGLNTGEVIREEADLFGATVNAAARIADHASAGEILLPDAVKGVLGAATTVELEDRGEVELKGFPEPLHLHAVRWEEKAAGPAFGERTPYVGRAEERAQLRRWLDEAAQGKGALVMIGGGPGVGKTRIAQGLADEAGERSFLALTGHCYEMEGAPPYIPFVEILEAAGRIVPPEAFREALGDAAPEVAKLMPEIRRMFPDIPPAAELPAEQERRYLFNSFLEFIERASRIQPVLLVLEDLHWGDDSSLLLLQHLAPQLDQMPVLVVGTYRDVELDVARPLAKALEELLRQRLAHDMILRPLPEADVEAMLRVRSGQDPPARLVEVIYRETEGNPFFVEEVFRHLAEADKLFDAEGRWLSDLDIGEEEVPRGVRLVIGRRLERVSEECRRALTAAAVVGRAFSYELLQELVDVDEDALLDAVDEAGRAQLVSSAAVGGEARFTFAHEQIRQTLLSTLQLPRRQRLHLQVAEAIEGLSSASPEEHASDLAHHLYQAGSIADTEKTVRYLTLAGDQAIAAAAFEDALRLYENALSLHPPDDRRGCADLLFKRGRARRSLARWDEALADWREAMAAYEELGDVEAVGRISSDIVLHLMAGARYAEAVEISRRGLIALGERVSVDRCRLLGFGGWVLGGSGNYQGGETMISQALSMAEELGDRHLLGLVLADKTSLHMWYLRPGEEVDSGLRAVELLRSAREPWALVDALWITQWTLLHLGRFDEAAAMAKEGEPLALRVGHLVAVMSFRRGSSFGEFMLTGDLDRWEQFWRGDLEMCRSADMPWISASYSALAMGYFFKGRLQEAAESAQEAVRLEPPGTPFAGTDWAALFVGRAYIGDRDAALSMLEQRRSALPRPGRANTIGAWNMLMAVIEGLAMLEERDEAAKLYPPALEMTGTAALTNLVTGPSHKYAGIAAACGGQWEKAEQHYGEALRLAHELPVVMAQPEVRRWYARMLIDRDAAGDRDKAFRLLTEAIVIYRQIGMPKHVEMAETMLGEV